MSSSTHSLFMNILVFYKLRQRAALSVGSEGEHHGGAQRQRHSGRPEQRRRWFWRLRPSLCDLGRCGAVQAHATQDLEWELHIQLGHRRAVSRHQRILRDFSRCRRHRMTPEKLVHGRVWLLARENETISACPTLVSVGWLSMTTTCCLSF